MQYQFKQSAGYFAFTLWLYGLAILAVGLYISSLWLMVSLITLLILSLQMDRARHRTLQARDPVGLTLNDKTGRIELHQQDSRQQFTQFRLFANRWFLILQLQNDDISKNLLLVPQRFSSISEFLRCRYQVTNMSKN